VKPDIPQTLTVTVPFTIRKRGGRKAFEMPVSEKPCHPKPDNSMIKALARAFRWKGMLESGQFATIGDLAAYEQIAPSYMTRVMRLTLLAPEIVEGILDSRIAARLAELMEPFPAEWERQGKSGIAETSNQRR
jgi:hypothetical protein